MPTKIKDARPPHGLARKMYRLPIWLFHIHQGWMLRGRFLLLTHTGRKSGLPRQTVLEVIQHDKATDTYYVFAGFGEQSDWLRNIEKTPEVVINVGHRSLCAIATRLSTDDAELKILDYARRNPIAIRVLPRLMGYTLDGSEADFRALARLGIVVAFQPAMTQV